MQKRRNDRGVNRALVAAELLYVFCGLIMSDMVKMVW